MYRNVFICLTYFLITLIPSSFQNFNLIFMGCNLEYSPY